MKPVASRKALRCADTWMGILLAASILAVLLAAAAWGWKGLLLGLICAGVGWLFTAFMVTAAIFAFYEKKERSEERGDG